MGFFSALGAVAGNWMEVKALDAQSDLHISNICKFDPLRVKGLLRKQVSEAVKQMIINRLGPQYTVEDVALMKLLMYGKVFVDSHGTSDENCQNIIKGIKRLQQSEDIDPMLSIEATTFELDNPVHSDQVPGDTTPIGNTETQTIWPDVPKTDAKGTVLDSEQTQPGVVSDCSVNKLALGPTSLDTVSRPDQFEPNPRTSQSADAVSSYNFLIENLGCFGEVVVQLDYFGDYDLNEPFSSKYRVRNMYDFQTGVGLENIEMLSKSVWVQTAIFEHYSKVHKEERGRPFKAGYTRFTKIVNTEELFQNFKSLSGTGYSGTGATEFFLQNRVQPHLDKSDKGD